MLKLARLFVQKGFYLTGLGLVMTLFMLILVAAPADKEVLFSSRIFPIAQAASPIQVAKGFSPTVTTIVPEDITFRKNFTPQTIGPGSVSTLQFDIANTNQVDPVSNLAFSDTLPTGVVIATPANAATTCDDSAITAPDGGSTISFTSSRLGISSSCVVTVNVTSSSPGTHTNVSGDLTSSAGNSGSATANLIVDSSRPGFKKSFSPGSITLGNVSALVFTIDNTANQSPADLLSFTDNLPGGMVIANPANATTDCTGEIATPALTATAGTSVITLSFGYVGEFSSCTVTVDVTTDAAGQFINTTGELTSGFGGTSSSFASAMLDVQFNFLVKSFTDDPVAPGRTVTLEFIVTNFDRSNAASNISFTDDLDKTLSGLVAAGLPLTDACGAGSQLSGDSLLTLTGGNLAPEASCTFSVTLQAPVLTLPGTFTNTTSSVTFDIAGDAAIQNPATDNLIVSPIPILTKTFVNDPVAAGDTVTLTFAITNTSAISAATDIAFTDDLDTMLGGTTATNLPADGFCGAGSSIIATTNVPPFGNLSLSMTGGNLAAGASCTFDVTLLVPATAPAGAYPNATSAPAATVGGVAYTGNPATDDLVVVAAPVLSKSFTDDPVIPGNNVTLEFTLAHSENAPADATGIAFTDDLDATLSGLAATGLPLTDVCGAGSQIAGSTNLSFTGGSLTPGASCTFSVTLQVPAAATAGNHTNTTSNVTATVGGLTVTENPASDDLQVAGLTLVKSFTDDPVVPNGAVTLEFTLSNTSPVSDTTAIAFTDDLDAVLSGLAATGLPISNVCGAGSQISGTGLLTFTGGSLLAETSCTFSVSLLTPASAAPNEYANTTSVVTADAGGVTVTADPASDNLTVIEAVSLTKSFTDDPVAPGDTVTLEFTLSNADPAQSAVSIAFTDDLDASLSGLAAVGLPANDVCGAGSQISGTNLLTFTGGNLAPGGSCTFSVTLQVPTGTTTGGYINTTSQVTSDLGGNIFTSSSASDTLSVFLPPAFSKNFAPNFIGVGNPSVLTFTIDNAASATSATSLDFTDNLPSGMVVATPANASTTCIGGALTATAGSSVISYTGGSVAGGALCTLSVDVTGNTAGVYVNTTGDLTSSLGNSGPTNDTLTVNPQPGFSKSFAPNAIETGDVSTLTFTIDNTASTVDATSLNFTDNLPVGVVVAAPANAITTCTGGALTAAAGTNVIAYSGGAVSAGSSCSVQVDVTSSTAGTYVNTTGDFTSSLGSSGTASDTLSVTGFMYFPLILSDFNSAGGG